MAVDAPNWTAVAQNDLSGSIIVREIIPVLYCCLREPMSLQPGRSKEDD